MSKTYEIGSKSYRQEAIVLGQLGKLTDLLQGLQIDVGGTAPQVLFALQGKVPDALAIVLIADGEDVRQAMTDEAVADRADALAWSLTPEKAVEVIEDFFDVNPISSIGEKIRKALAGMRAATAGTPSSASSTSSPEATSRVETRSSGESRPEPPSNGPGTDESEGGTISVSS